MELPIPIYKPVVYTTMTSSGRDKLPLLLAAFTVAAQLLLPDLALLLFAAQICCECDSTLLIRCCLLLLLRHTLPTNCDIYCRLSFKLYLHLVVQFIRLPAV